MEPMLYAKGICWIGDCRIPSSLSDIETNMKKKPKEKMGMIQDKWETNSLRAIETTYDIRKGRFPANILVSDDMLNDGVISKSQDNIRNNTLEQKIYGGGNGLPPQASKGFNDKGTNSRYYDIDKWFNNLLEL